MKKADILALLRERADFVSGQEICSRFGVSRNAVWKAVNRLKREGYLIEAAKNKGYRLVAENKIYGRNEIASRLTGSWAGKCLKYFESLDSTNARAKKEAEEGAAHGTVVAADAQTAGRGRRGRGWASPAGRNLYFTLILKPEFAPDRASMLTLVMAVAVAEAIRRETGLEAWIKWPNDIVVNGKKVCGILTEMSAEQDYIHYVVTGVGINVGRQEFAPELRDKAACLAGECGREISRACLLALILEIYEKDYEDFVRAGDLTPLLDRYQRLLVNRDAEVCVLDPGGTYRGIARGITPRGELWVELEDGSFREVYAGEVSVRGIYGYV